MDGRAWRREPFKTLAPAVESRSRIANDEIRGIRLDRATGRLPMARPRYSSNPDGALNET
jgi:hypothetical protein